MPVYTFGGKTCRNNGLVQISGTPINLGPNQYRPNYKTMSIIRTDPKYSFGAKKKENQTTMQMTGENYYIYSSINEQKISKRKNIRSVKFGKSTRNDNFSFPDTKSLKINLPHAKY